MRRRMRLPLAATRADLSIEKGKIEIALARLQVFPIPAHTHSVDREIGEDGTATCYPGGGEGEDALRNIAPNRGR